MSFDVHFVSKCLMKDFLTLKKGDTVNIFQYNMKMVMVNVLNISTIYWLSAALIKKKKKSM